MESIAFFDTKQYDKIWFDKLNSKYEIKYIENKLNHITAPLAKDCTVVCSFVNDDINKNVINILYESNIKLLAMRCAGYSNVDFKEAYRKINIVRVPDYSPYAVAEHATALLLSLNRKIHKAYNRTRDFNFNLTGLIGHDLYGKTVGIIGTGKIGQVFINICRGFGMKVIANDLYPVKDSDIDYVDLDTLFRASDIISLHCPLTNQTKYIIDDAALGKMKDGVILINTSRGALVDSIALLDSLNSGKVGGAGLDVYEEEADLFFEDFSNTIIKDDVLALLVSRPNVVITSHQAFLTHEALRNIADTTLKNIDEFFEDKILTNEVCYQCGTGKVSENCNKNKYQRCF